MLRREMGSKRGSLPPKEGDLTCMKTSLIPVSFTLAMKKQVKYYQ